MSYETLQVAIEGKVATVTLNRPDIRNAFNEQTITELAAAFDGLSRDEELAVTVLAANGAAFCAGADLNWMKKMAGYTEAENTADAMQLARMLRTIYMHPKPVIAKVHGDCYAGGMGLVAACDVVVAADSVHFCLSEVRLGLIPATISPYVIKAMGEQAARRYFLTAERFSAAQAHVFGFVHEVVSAAEIDAKVADIVKSLLGNSPHAVKEAKSLVREIAGQPVDDALLADTARRIANIRASEQGRDGVRSFLDKSKPGWLR